MRQNPSKVWDRTEAGTVGKERREWATERQRWRDLELQAGNRFLRRWSLEALRAADPELHEAIEDQRAMFGEALTGTKAECELHCNSMCRGWTIAIRRMEQLQIPEDGYQQIVAEVMRLWPGAKLIAIRNK